MGPEVIIATLVPLAFFAMIFGIIYIRNRENMALIEKGINPRNQNSRPRPFVNLKYGLLLIGSGLGLLFAFIIDTAIMKDKKSEPTTQIITRTVGNKGHLHKMNVKEERITVKDTTAAENISAVGPDSTIAKSNGDEDGVTNEHIETFRDNDQPPAIYFALIAIGGGLGLFFSYRIEKKEWLDKKMDA